MKKLNQYQIICFIFILYVNISCEASKDNVENDSLKSIKCNFTKINLLQQALDKDVTSVWPFNKSYSLLNNFYLDINKFWSVIQYPNNERLVMIAEKILHGETINVVVFGGSNTAGGGIEEDEKSIIGRYPILIKTWWDNAITPATGSRLNIQVNGIGGTSSSYYQFCYKVYLDHKNIDLFILDVSVNDAVLIKFKNANNNASLPLEQFTRELLNEPNKPAVMFINFFLTVKTRPDCFNLVDLGQSGISNHYNLTTINPRNFACYYKAGKFHTTRKTAKYQTTDKYHMSLLGHAQSAFMIIQVIKNTVSKVINDTHDLTNKTTYDCPVSSKIPKYQPLPPPKYIKPTPGIITNSLCWTGLVADRKILINNNLKVFILKAKGFSYTKHMAIKGTKHLGKLYRTDCFSCWHGSKKGSEIIFSFEIQQLSSINIFTRSRINNGELEVWLDEDKNKRVRIYPRVRSRQTVVLTVATGVIPGNHTLTIRITKDGNIPIVGIAATAYSSFNIV